MRRRIKGREWGNLGLGLCLLIFGHFVFLTPREVFGSATGEIWIGYRTDGKPGAGTLNDPFDGSSQQKFDDLISAAAPSTCIHLGVGTFLTKGIVLKEGFQISGTGKDATTIKLADGTQTPDVTQTNVISYWGPREPLDRISIRDLTLDANRDAQPTVRSNLPGHVVGALMAYVRNASVSGVRAIGTWANPGEGFVFALVHGGGWRPADRIEIRGCENLNPVSGRGGISGICAFDQERGTFSGFIRECVVTDNRYGTGVGATGSTDFVVADNYVHNVFNGTNFDTWDNTRLDIHGNHYSEITGYGILYNSSYRNIDIRIHDNTIHMATSAVAAAINAAQTKTRSFIYNNLILQNSFSAPALDFGPNASGEIRNNVIQEKIATNLSRTTVDLVVRDNRSMSSRSLSLGKSKKGPER